MLYQLSYAHHTVIGNSLRYCCCKFNVVRLSPCAVRLGGPGGSCPGRRPLRSRRTLFANGRTPLAAAPVHHTDRKRALCPASAASGWPLSLPQRSAFALFSCALSVILTEERPLEFQLRRDKTSFPCLAQPILISVPLFLGEEGVETILIDSGNGFHLMIRVDLKCVG